MIVRILLLLALTILVLRLVARWRAPKVAARRQRGAVQMAVKCPDCSAYVFDSRPEPCERSDCRYRRARPVRAAG
jgi:hypothetical protein